MKTSALVSTLALVACGLAPKTALDAAPNEARTDALADAASDLLEADAAARDELDAGASRSEVRWYGNLGSVFAGNWDAATSLREAVPAVSSYALGALSELRGEFLVIRGNAMLVYPSAGELPRVVAAHPGRGSEETATLLVAADVRTWREFPIELDIPSHEIEAWLGTTAATRGVDVSRPFPFLLQGRFRNVGWHVADGTRVLPGMRPDTNAQHGTIAEGSGTVVGFYSTAHQGVFTMMGEHTHMHIVLSDHSVLGHVRALDVVRGSTLSLP